MLLKWRWDRNTRFLPLPLVSADVDAILVQSSRIWPFLNSQVLPVRAEWLGFILMWEERFSALLCPEPRTSQNTNVPLKSCYEHLSKTPSEHRPRARSLRGEICFTLNAWHQNLFTYISRQDNSVYVHEHISHASTESCARQKAEHILEHLLKIKRNKTPPWGSLKLFACALSSASTKQGVCTEVPANSCH